MIDITTPAFFRAAMNSLLLEEETSTGADVSLYVLKCMRYSTQCIQATTPDAEIIRLKRTQNSLLNITRIPPEILGHIFRFNVAEVGNPYFSEIPKGSYNFLLVCHHWFQVALRTPELWTSWGNNLKDWKRWYIRSGISALDLILDGQNRQDDGFDEALRDALRDRAARDVIRKVHLRNNDMKLLTAIVSSLIPEGENVRPSSIESIVLSDVDVSDLFARHRFPKLCNIRLSGRFRISSWDHLKSTTTALTSLSLGPADTFPTSLPAIPTTSQILSLLASNPNLQSLTLSALPINDDDGGGPRPQVPLHHLEYILLSGTFHHVFPILHQLEFPERMDYGEIALHDCTPQGILEAIGPYIRDYLRRDPRFRDRLGMFVSSTSNCISLHASVVGVGRHHPNRLPHHGPPYARFRAMIFHPIPYHEATRLCTDVLALLPRGSLVSLETDLSVTEEIVVAMPNLEALYLITPVVPGGFLLPDPNGPNAHKKLLPSLRWLCMEDAEAAFDDWEPLVTYLAHQTSGNQAVLLDLFGDGVHVCPEVIERIEGLVEELVYVPDPYQECPFDRCPLAE